MIIDCPSIAKSFDAKLQVAVQQVPDSGTTLRMCEIVATQMQSTLSCSTTKKRKADELCIQYETLKFGQDVHLSEILEKISPLLQCGRESDRSHSPVRQQLVERQNAGQLLGLENVMHLACGEDEANGITERSPCSR